MNSIPNLYLFLLGGTADLGTTWRVEVKGGWDLGVVAMQFDFT